MTSAIPARVAVVTLGARDLDALRDFYAGLGWPLAVDIDGFAAFRTHGAVLALFPLDELAADANAPPAAPTCGLRGFSLAVNVETPEQVDEAIAAAADAGARVTKEPVQAEWGGRSAYFADPEDNHWEVAWVPPDSLMAAAIERAGGFGG
ncbi:MAG: VOC family protein [Actinomycetota bacterium]|nr:VOC family protein [Actinomycetota bacterium]